VPLLGNPVGLPQPLHFLLISIIIECGYPMFVDTADALGASLLIKLPGKRIDMIQSVVV
jgi:hypothetical protein